MKEIKVCDLAKQYGLTNEQMIEYLDKNEIEIVDSNSTVDVEFYKDVIKMLERNIEDDEHRNKSSIQWIRIEGLFGKYDYTFDFNKDIAIWVSENGVGKTTILNLIVAVLNNDPKTLMGIDFKKIILRTSTNQHTINKPLYSVRMGDNEVRELFMKMEEYLPPDVVRRFYTRYRRTRKIDIQQIEDSIRIRNFEVSSHWDDSRAERLLKYLAAFDNGSYETMLKKLREIRAEMHEECLFYPTYRRIEISLDKVFIDNARHSSSELIQYIGFGMNDVDTRIEALINKMRSDANASYVEMNSDIINELSEGMDIVSIAENMKEVDPHKLDVVIKRIGEERIASKDKLVASISNSQNKMGNIFLKYYLGKLMEIYDSQKAIDDKLSNFAKVCTKYLKSKTVVYDETMLTLSVYNEDHEKLRWDDLSSGEKQIVAIFSKVYLDVTTSAIFIIDEPEISLSLEWQKEFLKDIYNSGKVALLIATTHSPFIFKNDYRQYTNEIELYRG